MHRLAPPPLIRIFEIVSILFEGFDLETSIVALESNVHSHSPFSNLQFISAPLSSPISFSLAFNLNFQLILQSSS